MRLKRLIQDELEVCEAAIKAGDSRRAEAKIADAVRKTRQLLKELA